MGVMVIAAYRPRAGKESRLLEILKEHLPILRGQGLVTDRAPYAMRAEDGTILEVFEWKSEEAIAAAHKNEVVLAMWKRFEEACEYVPLAKVKESGEMFPGFVPVELGGHP